MGRPRYVCTTCSEHFTRKYSAKRHNITVHHNNEGGEIVTLVEYVVGRNSGRYQASHPSWHRLSKEKSIHNFGHATAVADSVGEALREGGLQRQQQGQYQYHQQSLEEQERYHRQWQQGQSMSPSPAAIQDQPPDVMSLYPNDRPFQSQSINTMDNEETVSLSQETILKIEELKRLVNKYAQYHRNPGAVINCIIYYCSNGDNTLLDEKLEQLRSIDAISKY